MVKIQNKQNTGGQARWRLTLLCLALTVGHALAYDNNIQPSLSLTTQRWNAHWVTYPEISGYEYGVYHFRKTFDMESVPSSFIINVSGDNRYRLFVNGISVCRGPARGDPDHWYFETVDISPFLKPGKNSLAAVVWNFGIYKPGAQMSLKTGFILQGNSEKEEIVNTGKGWKVYENNSYSPLTANRHDVGCSDKVDGNLYPWGWEETNYNDEHWEEVSLDVKGQPYGTGTEYTWVLRPRDIPMMEESVLRMAEIRKTEGIQLSRQFLEGKSPLLIPANKKVTLLIDQSYLTTAYPVISLSGGKGTTIQLTYAESLTKNGEKNYRGEIEGKELHGPSDMFIADGSENRIFSPLWFRTYRYIALEVETKEESILIHDLYGIFTAYPFSEKGAFSSNDPALDKIWEVGWRTARLCAHETYFDCPYYEQLQYIGDTRIQALISLYVSGDDRLMRKAILLFDWSRTHEGITLSRYPTRLKQIIPPFSLYWINMVHDYMMYRDDPEFIQSCIPGVKTILEWFEDKIDHKTGLLGHIPHWNFVDWPKEWPWSNLHPTGGVPPGAIEGGSAILSLQLAYTLKDAVELLSGYGEEELAKHYQEIYQSICTHAWEKYWDEEKKLLKDDLEGTSYSQHANIMGILSDAIPVNLQADLLSRIVKDTSLIQATYYYRFYLFRALKKAGLSNQYLSNLQPWYDMLDLGLTTFAEEPEPSRSDCHAWSASPLFDFLATVCGIEPAEAGFRSVKIEPAPGHLKEIKGIVPHPSGKIEVNLKKSGKHLIGTIILPTGLSGLYKYGSNNITLQEGINQIN